MIFFMLLVVLKLFAGDLAHPVTLQNGFYLFLFLITIAYLLVFKGILYYTNHNRLEMQDYKNDICLHSLVFNFTRQNLTVG